MPESGVGSARSRIVWPISMSGKPREDDDVAGRGFGHLDARDALEHVDLAGPALLDDRAVGPDGGELDRLRHGARENAADGQPAEVVRIVDVGDDHLVRRVADFRRRDVLEDRVEEGPQIARLRVGIPRDVAQPAGAVEDLELEVVLFGREREEEIVDFLLDLLRPRVGAVDLVDQHDRPLAAFEGLLQDEPRLRQRAFGGVDEEEHSFDHRQDALDLGTEVPVARRVHDVDDDVLVVDGRVLGEDRDASLLLELARVHDEIVDVLPDAERPALLEQRVDERGLPVVDVRDNGDAAPVGTAGGGGGVRGVGGHGRTAEPTPSRAALPPVGGIMPGMERIRPPGRPSPPLRPRGLPHGPGGRRARRALGP